MFLSETMTDSHEAINTVSKPKNKGGRKILDPNGEKHTEKVIKNISGQAFMRM